MSEALQAGKPFLCVHVTSTIVTWVLIATLVAGSTEGTIADRLSQVGQRVWRSAMQAPEVPDWVSTLVILASLAGLLIFGKATSFLEGPRAPANTAVALRGLVITQLMPGLVEEILFRAALLPPGASVWVASAALLAFLVYHLDLVHQQQTFRDPRFLVMALLLGIACTTAFLACGYSLWPPAILHGLLVWVWVFLSGGEEKLRVRHESLRGELSEV